MQFIHFNFHGYLMHTYITNEKKVLPALLPIYCWFIYVLLNSGIPKTER